MFFKKDKKSHDIKISIIQKGTLLNGDIKTDDLTRIEGKIVGEIVASEKIIIANSGVVIGNIYGTEIKIEGKVTGDIYAQGSCIVSPGGSVSGDITAKEIRLLDDSHFEGSCEIISSEQGSKTDNNTGAGDAANANLESKEKLNKTLLSSKMKNIKPNEN